MNVWVWGILWLVVGWLLGILAYFTAGLFTLPASAGVRNRAANYYSKQAMKLLERAALVERGTTWDIYSTSHDADKNVDGFTVDGNQAHVSNDTGLLSTLHKKPFGLVPPPEVNVASYVSPELGEIGRIDIALGEQDNLPEDGDGDLHVQLPRARPLVKMRETARRMIPGSRSLWDIDETIELYKQSQHGFASTQTQQFMILIIAYGVGSLLTWLIVTNAGGAAPTGISVPGI